MNNTQAPDRNPDLGVWTPAYAAWALNELTDDEFEAQFKQPKKMVAFELNIKFTEKKASARSTPKPPEVTAPEVESESTDEPSLELAPEDEVKDEEPKKATKKAAKKTANKK
ncbi:hypothetical protein OAI07_01315 [Akkermansiaceae bacterium]|nr:hypothetical protein [Akkermansiaceae bacterium]